MKKLLKTVTGKLLIPACLLVIQGCFEGKTVESPTVLEGKMKKSHTHTNRLIHEKSPYLQQHAHNPVDWYPWGDEAFAKAEQEQKPIFLSIGYSTCHWCHVMERESFESEDVASLLNGAFINIKVDREERPDIDSIYMTVCQMMTGSGGWPLTIIMTPDKKPFFAATYIPKEDRFGRSGLLSLIPQIKHTWENRKNEVLQSANNLTVALKNTSESSPGEKLDKEILKQAYDDSFNAFDQTHGGFGNSPKFPTPHKLIFLLRSWQKTGEHQALEMVEKTLIEMREGGIYDHIGFGFHRYSTDAHWLVPHFEKMLYDQALLIMAYTEAYQATRKNVYADTVHEIISYILRDMTSSEGGFYSAEDADSEGIEGKFYVWNTNELKNILNDDEFELLRNVFNVKPSGNFHEEATGNISGDNILHLTDSIDSIAEKSKVPLHMLKSRLAAVRKKLFEIREKRIHPFKDTKILCDWNGLMITALAKAARVFNQSEYKNAAIKATDFILSKMRKPTGRLFHRYKDGESKIPGPLEDYAFFIMGLLELYETTHNTEYLKDAIKLKNLTVTHFLDHKSGGFFSTPDDGEELLIRPKEIYDGAIPSGNSIMMLNLLKLARITGNTEDESLASQIATAFSSTVKRSPANFTALLWGIQFAVGPAYEIVVAGNPGAKDTNKIWNALNRIYLPSKVVLFRPEGTDNPEIIDISASTENQRMLNEKATVYICRDFTCSKPITDIDKMLTLLSSENCLNK